MSNPALDMCILDRGITGTSAVGATGGATATEALRAPQVRGPTIPSATRPLRAWKAFTAVSVFGPNEPSIVKPAFRAFCRTGTSPPVIPFLSTVLPGLGSVGLVGAGVDVVAPIAAAPLPKNQSFSIRLPGQA